MKGSSRDSKTGRSSVIVLRMFLLIFFFFYLEKVGFALRIVRDMGREDQTKSLLSSVFSRETFFPFLVDKITFTLTQVGMLERVFSPTSGDAHSYPRCCEEW